MPLHFGLNVPAGNGLRLTRENYAVMNNRRAFAAIPEIIYDNNKEKHIQMTGATHIMIIA